MKKCYLTLRKSEEKIKWEFIFFLAETWYSFQAKKDVGFKISLDNN